MISYVISRGWHSKLGAKIAQHISGKEQQVQRMFAPRLRSMWIQICLMSRNLQIWRPGYCHSCSVDFFHIVYSIKGGFGMFFFWECWEGFVPPQDVQMVCQLLVSPKIEFVFCWWKNCCTSWDRKLRKSREMWLHILLCRISSINSISPLAMETGDFWVVPSHCSTTPSIECL